MCHIGSPALNERARRQCPMPNTYGSSVMGQSSVIAELSVQWLGVFSRLSGEKSFSSRC